MSSISSHQHNVGKKGVAIVVFIGISAVAFHDDRGEKHCRVAICCQNVNNGTHVLKKPTIKGRPADSNDSPSLVANGFPCKKIVLL